MEGASDNASSGPDASVATAPAEPAHQARPATPPRRSRLPLLAGAGAAVLVLLGAGALVGHLTLSQAYSPRRALTDYFAAQARADAAGMWANASYTRGEGAFSDFFTRDALAAMMKLPQNRDLHDVKIVSLQRVDAATVSATVSMAWSGTVRTEVFTVRQDPSRVHFLFYPSWKVEVAPSTLHLTLPNQPGPVSVDGTDNPSGASTAAIPVLMGFHQVTMGGTELYDAVTQVVDAVAPAGVTVKGTLSGAAIAAAKDAVTKTMTTVCDVARYQDCPGHTYTAPDSNFIYFFTLPGYGNVDYTKYVVTMAGDPTAGMTMTVSADPGKVTVSGSCGTTWTVDGRRTYHFKGDYSGTLTWNGTGFSADLVTDCGKARA